MWATLIFGGTAGLFLFWMFSTLWHIRWVRRLPALDMLPPALNSGHIKCSIVIAARDEEARIEQTIRHLLAQRGVEIEIIVVDDRSGDRTNEILTRLAEEDARVQVKRVDVLPDDWQMSCMSRRRQRGNRRLDTLYRC
jgi:cellulose synthase/poly-beta-1,6-N-acetylglucosamine synthase-like glycosyltransferase